ncbi:MAG: diguanylate cyclase domain-containing protein [Pseudomonadota bacterium]
MSHIPPENPAPSPEKSTVPVKVLLVDTHIETAETIEKSLLIASDGAFSVVWARRISQALEHLARGDIEVVLAVLDLADCEEAKVFQQLQLSAPEALVLPLGKTSAHSMPEQGRQNTIDMDWLPGALDYVARRKNTEAAWRAADEALFEEKERARVTLGSIGDAVLVTDILGNVTYLNQVAENLTQWHAAHALGTPLPEVFDITISGSGKRARNPALHAMTENTTVGLAANCVLHRLDGTEIGIEDSAAPVHDRYGEVTGAVIVFRDVNQSRRMTRKMAWLASHDSLTGLASRVLFEERFAQVIGLAKRQERQVALLFVDLDRFKQINDQFGHEFGDCVLKAVGARLLRGVRDSDTVCRHGGDEFIILLADVADPAAAHQVANKLASLFTAPLLIDSHPVQVAMSIGISIYPDDGNDMNSLIKHADTAMYRVKIKTTFPSQVRHPRTELPARTD